MINVNSHYMARVNFFSYIYKKLVHVYVLHTYEQGLIHQKALVSSGSVKYEAQISTLHILITIPSNHIPERTPSTNLHSIFSKFPTMLQFSV